MRMGKIQHLPFFFVLSALVLPLSACSPKTTVILLPEKDGKSGLITVQSGAASATLSQPGETTEVAGNTSAPKPVSITDEKQIKVRYGKVLDAMPPPPIHFLLYYLPDKAELTVASANMLPDIILAIEERNSTNISVIGHTDTAGDDAYNYQLSKKRAMTVAEQLMSMGVKKEYIDVTSHGEENLLVKTADNVQEPKNRRVEVVIR